MCFLYSLHILYASQYDISIFVSLTSVLTMQKTLFIFSLCSAIWRVLTCSLGYFYPTSEVLAGILRKTPELEVLHISEVLLVSCFLYHVSQLIVILHLFIDLFIDSCLGIFLFLDEGWTSNSLPWCFKYSLKVCSISDFNGDELEIQAVKFLLENASLMINIFCSELLSKNLEKLADVRNQLQALGLGRCVIKVQSIFSSLVFLILFFVRRDSVYSSNIIPKECG